MNEQLGNFVDLARFRQGMYRVFAAAFLPPQPKRFLDLIQDCKPLGSGGLGYLAIYQQWRPWRKAVLNIDEAVEADVKYVHAFSAGMSSTAMSPIAPVRSEAGEVLVDLTELYDEIRLEPTGAISDSLDDVSMELEIMSVLCAREADARAVRKHRRLEATLTSQVTFLDRYLDTQLPQFVDQITHMNPVPFYSTLGPAVASFVHHDRGIARFLVEEVAKLEPSR